MIGTNSARREEVPADVSRATSPHIMQDGSLGRFWVQTRGLR